MVKPEWFYNRLDEEWVVLENMIGQKNMSQV